MTQSTEPTDIPTLPPMSTGPIPEGHMEAGWVDMEQVAEALNAGAALIQVLRDTVTRRDATIAQLRKKLKLLKEPR